MQDQERVESGGSGKRRHFEAYLNVLLQGRQV